MGRFLGYQILVQKKPAAAGSPIFTPTPLPQLSNHHGHMAPSIRRNYLVCFYCNKRSGIKYDGLIRKWDCAKCDATNFLDENGEITDPIVAADIAPANLTYSTTGPKLPVSSQLSGSESEPALFCSTCLKNQHLYTASIAQYDLDTDTRRPGYAAEEREYYKWRGNLERLYPQVCEDCQPKVLQRMRESGRNAKTDHLRRLMDKSRARRSAPSSRLSISGFVIHLGQILWYIGIVGQLLWNLTAIIGTTQYDQLTSFISSTPGPLASLLRVTLHTFNSNAFARNTLLCSFASVWWCPKYREAERGFMKHINGYSDWYKIQLFLVIVRSFFYYFIRSGALTDPFAPATLGTHAAMCLITMLIFTMAHRAFKVDMSPLWAETPEKLRIIGPRSNSGSPPRGARSMADILDEIGSSSRHDRSSSPRSPQAYPSPISPQTYTSQAQTTPAYLSQSHNTDAYASGAQSAQMYNRSSHPSSFTTQGYNSKLFPQRQRQQPNTERPTTPPERVRAELSRDRPLLSEMSSEEGTHWMSTGILPTRFHERYGHSNAGVTDTYTEEMEWIPTVPQKSVHRAFNPPHPQQNSAHTFGETPVGDRTSPFWFKVPPAPITPAHKLRNPPNQPRLRVASQEVKENFFIRPEAAKTKSPDRTEDFAEQKFFFPEKSSEGDALAGLLDSFSLTEGDRANQRDSRVRSYFVLALLAGAGMGLAWCLSWLF